MRSETLEIDSRQDENDSQAEREERKQARLQRQIKKVRSGIEDYMHETYNELGVASTTENEDVRAWLSTIDETEEGLRDLELFRQWSEQARKSARILHAKFHTELAEALRKNIITDSMAGVWIDRFVKSSYKQCEVYVHGGKLGRWIAEAEKLNTARETLARKPMVRALSKKDVGDIDALRDPASFASLTTNSEKKALLKEVEAAIRVSGSPAMKELHRKAKELLTDAAEQKIMSRKKISVWMGRIFNGKFTPEEIDAFLDSQKGGLRDLKAEWSRLRGAFDDIENRKAREGVPRSFHFVRLDVFLDWHRDKRNSYIKVANESFDIDREHPALLDIRREIAARDWETAEHLINGVDFHTLDAKEKGKLQSMKEFIRAHKPKDVSEVSSATKSPRLQLENTVNDMRNAIAQMPPALQHIYAKAINRGPSVLACLCSTMYNRVWWHTSGGLDDNTEIQLLRSHELKKQERKKNGETGEAWDSVSLYNERMTGETLDELQQFEKNHKYKYYKTLIPEGVDYATHAHIVRSLQPILRSGQRKLRSMGVSFTLAGDEWKVSLVQKPVMHVA